MGVSSHATILFSAAIAIGSLASSALADASLAPVEHPMYRVSTPTWGVPSVSEGGQQGHHVWMAPDRRIGLYVEWAFLPPLDLDASVELLTRSLAPLGEVVVTRPKPIEARGGPVRFAVVAVDGISSSMTTMRCHDAFNLTVSLRGRVKRAELIALHRRIAPTLRCGPTTSPPLPIRPRWTPPTGFVEQWSAADGWGFTRAGPNGREETVVFLPASAEASWAETLHRNPAARLGIIKATVDDHQPLADPPPRMVDGVRRRFYAFSGAVSDGHTRERINGLLTAWPCPKAGVTLSAIYMTPVGTPVSDGVPALAAARCPESR